MSVTDVIADPDMTEETRADMKEWTGVHCRSLDPRRIRVDNAVVSDDEIQPNDPQTLYRKWEELQWNPFAIDFSRDREQWAGMGETDQGRIHWVLASLMVADERITTKFS